MHALWDPTRSYMRVVLEDVQTEARVGLHPWEQFEARPTRLLVSVEMFALHDGGEGAMALPVIDYDPVRGTIAAWRGRPHTPLLETLAEELVSACFDNPRVQACRVWVRKPDVFNEAASAGVEFYRIRAA